MANAPISEELTALKKRARRRLVGAIVLVLVALAALWTVMDDKPPQSLASQPVAIVSSTPNLASTVPALPSVISDTKPPKLPAEAPPSSAISNPVSATPPASSTVYPPAEKGPAPLVAEKVESTPPVKTVETTQLQAVKRSTNKDPAKILAGMGDEVATAPAHPVTTKEVGQFFLQLGAFADKEKSHGLLVKAQEAGVAVQSESVTTEKGTLNRLRAGPYSSRVAVEKAHSQLANAGIASTIIGK